jgi:hypothetical protein
VKQVLRQWRFAFLTDDEIFLSTTTARSLGALLKSARDIMRKDKRLKGPARSIPT